MSEARPTWPPGLMGRIADYILESAHYPVPTVALAASIGLMAGICGRAYNVVGSGLNQYLLVVAATGSGKEAAQSGISRLIESIRPQVPSAVDFIGPAAFASGPALIRVLDKRPCFLSVLGEFGHTLATLSDPRAPASTVMLLRALLDLYSKSGRSGLLLPTAYSDSERNTLSIVAPAVSILAETTPDSVFRQLSPRDISSGLLPRFLLLEHEGPRPYRNPKGGTYPPQALVDELATLAAAALTMAANHATADVDLNRTASVIFESFENECTDAVNAGTELERHLWSRANLKALRLAALVAVGCNPNKPEITGEHAQWAMDLVRKDVEAMVGRFASGDIGSTETRQEADLRRAIHDYFRMPVEKRASYKVPRELLEGNGLAFVPYAYLQRRAKRLASFTTDPRGLSTALDRSLKELVKTGALDELERRAAIEHFRTTRPLYAMGACW